MISVSVIFSSSWKIFSLLNPPPPNEKLKEAAKEYNDLIGKPFAEMLVKEKETTPTPLPTETPTPTPTSTETPTPTPTPTESGTPTPTPTYLDNINVVANGGNFFNTPAEGYTDGQLVDEIPTPFLEEAIDEFNQQSIEEEIETTQLLDDIQSEIINEEPTTLNDTSSEEDEKKNLIEFQQPMLDLVISEDLETEEITETSESTDYSTQSQTEDLYWEKDDINPNQIIYDLENNKVIIPVSEEEIVVTPTPEPLKVISRNVSSRRRKFR